MVAGRQPAPRSSWLWPLTTAALAIVSAALSWQLYARGEPTVIERLRIVERMETKPKAELRSRTEHLDKPHKANVEATYVRSTQTVPRDNYLRRRELALTFGMDALTVPVAFRTPDAADESSYRQLKSTYTESSSFGDEQNSEEDPTSRHLGDKS